MGKRRILGWVGVRFGNRDPLYPQTWGLVSRVPWRWLRRLCWWLCDRTGGHEWSTTEWGYGGCGIDRWCRWCNKLSNQPVAENCLTEEQRTLMSFLGDSETPDV